MVRAQWLLSACLLLFQAQDLPQPKLLLAGDARMLEGRIRLTPAFRQQAGAVWLTQKQSISNGFAVKFKFQLTEQGGLGDGADGFAFVLQGQGPDALAGGGAAGGFAMGDGYGLPNKPGIPGSVAVFFDTHRNRDAGDPSDNYVAICTNGALHKMRWPPNRLAIARKLPIRLKDGQLHQAEIRYAPPLITVLLDGADIGLQALVDFTPVLDAAGRAFIGFTASTGNGFENHDIIDWTFKPFASSSISTVDSNITFHLADCLPGKNLCTPPKALVEQTTPGSFHIVLPAHIPWAASIPTDQPFKLTNARGNVCWNLKAAITCSGPSAITTKIESGKTWFSVNAPAGRNFSANEGYFEFDLVLH